MGARTPLEYLDACSSKDDKTDLIRYCLLGYDAIIPPKEANSQIYAEIPRSIRIFIRCHPNLDKPESRRKERE